MIEKCIFIIPYDHGFEGLSKTDFHEIILSKPNSAIIILVENPVKHLNDATCAPLFDSCKLVAIIV